MNIINNKQFNFKGYENLLSYTEGIERKNNISVMAMKLNNEGRRDLDTWHNIQKSLNETSNPSDYIIFHALNVGDKAIFSIDKKSLNLNNVKSRSEESLFLKIYELISSLTERIANTDFLTKNSHLDQTLVELNNNLKVVIADQNAVDMFCKCAVNRVVPSSKTASLINSQMTREMLRYFK